MIQGGWVVECGLVEKRLSFECCWKLVQLITILNYIGTHYKHLAYCRVFYSGHWHRQNPKRFVVLEPKKVNAEKVAVSGKKRTQKLYRRHSGRPGGMKVETFDQLQQRIPERIVEHAVRGMLPKGRVSSEVL
ncbi:50S ribosomal protein L13, chloroplastic [Vitis vinifera]|uniref:50S ribosomal protein L13, chloroplastic n=1 Tax=Vitis vinifera TaxID=29760 RepID=A0A438HBR7_VITVI|nr:50S ribosomal protein L13, chloroplastic [Vitis vinifera]